MCGSLQARAGEFGATLQTPVLPSLLRGGLAHVLRWALDDATDGGVAAAVMALHALLVSEEDEVSSTCA